MQTPDAPSTGAPHVVDRGRRLAQWLVVSAAVTSIGFYVVTALQRIAYPYELQFFEGSTVEVSARVAEGLPLYGPPTTDFTPWPYPPLYFWITGQLARWTGIDLPTLRSVSFVASLISLLLIVLVVRRITTSTVAGLVAAGLFAGTYRVSGAWFDAARIDSLFVMLLLCAVYLGLRARTWRGGIGVGLLLLLAFLTKQNALVVAVPMLGWLLVRRRPVGVSASAFLAVTAIGSVLVGDAATGGWYSPYVINQLLGHGTVLAWLAGFWVVDLVLPFAVVLAALVWWSATRRPRPSLSPDVSFLVACVAGLWLAGLAGRLHDGGYVNVAIPAHVGMSLLLGVAAAAVIRHPRTSSRLLAVLAAVIVVQVAVMAAWRPDVVPTQSDRAAGDRFVTLLRSLPEDVLVPSHPYYLRLAGLPTHASAIAMGDLLATRPGPAHDALAAQMPWSLAGVNAVVLDSPTDAAMFGPELVRDFTRVEVSASPGTDFVPVTDVPTKPTVLYVRTTELLP